MVDVDTSEIDEAIASVEALGETIPIQTRKTVEDEVDNLVDAIQRNAEAKGLRDTGELIASFDSAPSGGSRWTIWSSAEHAMPLEEGASPHPITPDDARLLAWEPESSGDYPTMKTAEALSMHSSGGDAPNAWYDADAGMVFSVGVSHPGNEAYHYIRDAQTEWKPIAMIQVSNAVDTAIRAAGFSSARAMDDIGGMPMDLGGPGFIDG